MISFRFFFRARNIFVLWLLLPLLAVAQDKFSSPTGYVNDLENILLPAQAHELDSLLQDYDARTTRQIVVVTTPDFMDFRNIGEYSLALFNEWEIGQRETNNGLLIVLSSAQRKVRISTGSGTEQILTDAICKSIIDELMLPELRAGRYYEALLSGVRALMEKWN